MQFTVQQMNKTTQLQYVDTDTGHWTEVVQTPVHNPKKQTLKSI